MGLCRHINICPVVLQSVPWTDIERRRAVFKPGDRSGSLHCAALNKLQLALQIGIPSHPVDIERFLKIYCRVVTGADVVCHHISVTVLSRDRSFDDSSLGTKSSRQIL